MEQKLAIIGFGTVGQGLVELLLEKGQELQRLGLEFRVVAVSDLARGGLYCPRGLDLQTLLDVTRRTGSFAAYPDGPGLERGWDSLKAIRDTNADIVIEATFTNVLTGQPAIDHCRAAFESGKHVVTSNKGPVALAYGELSALARARGVRWAFEGTVMSGTPALRLPLLTLVGSGIQEIRGILNGTTNYILTRMEEGLEYAEALQEAQAKGYAEADPTSDIEGHDAVYKLVILANVLMGLELKPDQVSRQGISGLTQQDLEAARREGQRWKLLARVRRAREGLEARVEPVRLPLSDPLAGVRGVTNALTYQTDTLGPVTLVGPGAGRRETGYALLVDLIHLVRGFGMEGPWEVLR
ncbi:homoserine dehydrogenase [Thermus oshimai]